LFNHLPAQIIFIMVVLVVFTALAVGIPALLIIRYELPSSAGLPVETQSRLTTWLLTGMALVIALSSGLGMLLARRLSLPLERLRRAAVSLRMGDLNTPIQTSTRVKEISQVAAALEDARIALQHSLSELRREKEWSDHLLSAVVEGIVTLDRAGRISFFSPGAERISGWTAEAARSRPLDVVLPPAENEPGLSQRLSGQGGKQVLYPARFSQRTATLAVTSAPLGRPPQTGTVVVFRDVTDEEALHRLLGNFLADITHEFRTPLSAQAAAMELLIEQLPDLSPAELQDLLGSLRLGVLGLQTLIDNLLEGASIEAGRFKVQPRRSEVPKIVKDAVRTMQPLYDKYRRTLRVEMDAELPAVRVDHRRTVQALVNFLSNSVKWSPEGSEVVVKCTSLPAQEGDASTSPSLRGGKWVRISVLDCGPGVPEERRGDLFSRFTHQGSGERSDAGAGIGLSVVKAIIETQGGRVGVADRPGGEPGKGSRSGAEFWFTLPVDDEEPQA
jgi:PAS domain S-box-containing protein